MSRVADLHRAAMDKAEEAAASSIRGNREEAMRLFREAFSLERDAALQIATDPSAEPTRSILLRSAASLALDCGEPREAERLIAVGLSGMPPEEIADELRDLLEQVSFLRHLDLRGVTLGRDEFQLAIAGRAVGLGMADSDEFVSRVQHTEKLIFRTAERKRKRPFRDRGPAIKAIRESCGLFLSAPRAGSFSVTFRLGEPKLQLELPGLETLDGADIIDEVLTCLEVFERRDEDVLRAKIPDEAYRRNFVGLAQQLAPDGERVTTVGLTAFTHGKERRLALRKVGPAAVEAAAPPVPEPEPKESRVSLVGRLLFADSRSSSGGKIKLTDQEGVQHDVVVPEGMMSDIVKPLWEETVRLVGTRRKGVVRLEQIHKA